jgi:hypothetical protein
MNADLGNGIMIYYFATSLCMLSHGKYNFYINFLKFGTRCKVEFKLQNCDTSKLLVLSFSVVRSIPENDIRASQVFEYEIIKWVLISHFSLNRSYWCR